MKSYKIAIIGGGPAGLSLACLLGKQHTITIFERERNPLPVGAGIMLQPTGAHVLNEIGIGEAILSLGKKIKRFYSENHEGKIIFDLDFSYDGLYGTGIDRSSLFYSLFNEVHKRGVEVIVDSEINEINEKDSTIKDQHGNQFGKFDLIVVADGRGSLVRSQFSNLIKVSKKQRYAALWTKLPLADKSLNQGINHVYYKTELMLGLMPIGYSHKGSDEELINFFCGVNDEFLEKWSPAYFKPWKERLKKIAPKYEPFLDQIVDFDQLIVANYYNVLLKKPYHKNIVFIGDAAHSLSPHLSSGTNLALLDAHSLARRVNEKATIQDAFKRFQKDRDAQISYYHSISRLITPLFQSHTDLSFIRDHILSRLIKIPYFRNEILQTILGMKKNLFSNLPEKLYKDV